MKRCLLLALLAFALASLVACASQSSASAPKTSGRTVAGIKASVPTSPYLDGVHYRAGKPCEACHGIIPASGTLTIPGSAKCLPCHGGTYDGLASFTSALGQSNPHKSNPGDVACIQCHVAHGAAQ